MAVDTGWPVRFVAYEALLADDTDALRCLWPPTAALSRALRHEKHGYVARNGIPTKTLRDDLRAHVRNFDAVDAHFAAAAARAGEGDDRGALGASNRSGDTKGQAGCLLEMLRASSPRVFGDCLHNHILARGGAAAGRVAPIGSCHEEYSPEASRGAAR